MTTILKSRSSVEGLAMGTAWILVRKACNSETRTLPEAMDSERERLRSLMAGSSTPDIFSAHLEMLDDPLLQETIENHLSEGMTAQEAVGAAADDIAALLSESGDDYMAARADDVRDVCRGLAECLCGGSSNPFGDIPEDAVIVADELFPSDTAKMDFSKVRAFVTGKGSVTSHVSIIARSRGIPVVLGVDINTIKDGDTLLVDGNKAEVSINPPEAEIEEFRKGLGKKNTVTEEIRKLVKEAGVKIYANAGSVEDIKAAIGSGAEGIGLFRTEFLFMDRHELPSEEEQYSIYRQAVEACEGRPITIRTMDIGGDKVVPGLNIPKEDNPFLGMRAIRISLSKPELFKAQIRAILKASAFGTVRIMLPMITRVEEVTTAKALILECIAGLEASGTAFDRNVKVGIMVETPAAVLVSDSLATEVDFFSIGTNDLTQYIMAADRGNSSVSYLYNPLDPAVAKAVGMVVEAARKAGIQVGVCGEAAADVKAMEFFCRVGVNSLSLTSPSRLGLTA